MATPSLNLAKIPAMSRPMIRTMQGIIADGGVIGRYSIKGGTAAALVSRGYITPEFNLNGNRVHLLKPEGLAAMVAELPVGLAAELPTWADLLDEAWTAAHAEYAEVLFCPEPGCLFKATFELEHSCRVITREERINRHIAMGHLPIAEVTRSYWGFADPHSNDMIKDTHTNVLAWRAEHEKAVEPVRHVVDLMEYNGNWGFKCRDCNQHMIDFLATDIESEAGMHGDIAADSLRPEVEPVTLVSETPSVFADAPPVRTYSDGSQTYGPYGPIDKAAILAKPIDSLMNSGAVEPDPDPQAIADKGRAHMVAALRRHSGDHRSDETFVIGWLTAHLLKKDGWNTRPIEPETDGDARRILAECAGALLGLFEHEESK